MAHGLSTALWRSSMTVLRAYWKVARQLFHEATGAFFALFSVYGGAAAWKQFHAAGSRWIGAFALLYTIAMALFSVYAFRSARRVR